MKILKALGWVLLVAFILYAFVEIELARIDAFKRMFPNATTADYFLMHK
jgi:hypothetical protein